MKESDIPTKLLWIDLEMTGLDAATQRIIEVGIIVTDFEHNELASYEAIIHQPLNILANAEDWPKQNMKALFKEVTESNRSEAEVQQEVLNLITEHFGEERAVLAGNSIHQDRRFIRQWWPEIEARLHYRMLDVSSYKIWLQGAHRAEFEKSEAHRAMGDIRESISELKWSLNQLKD